MIAHLLQGEGIDLLGLGFGLLDAEDIGLLLFKEGEQPFGDGGTNAVDIVRDQFHGIITFLVPDVVRIT